MKNLPAIYDGDSGPVLRFQLKDGGTVVDLTSVVVELKVKDARLGTTICTRPGIPVSPKSGGYVDVWLKGLECDWDGAGRELLIVPKFYTALNSAGAAATNLLLNPSFDTYTGTLAVPSCTTTSGLKAVTSSAAFGKVYAGMTVTGTGIPASTHVHAWLNSSTIYLTNAATGSATVTLTFGSFGVADEWQVYGGSDAPISVTNGTTLLTSNSLFDNVVAGEFIFGPNITEGTTVISKADDSNLTMSAVSSGSASATRVFTRPGYGLGNMTFAVGADDPAPPVIFGSRQAQNNTIVQGTLQAGFLFQAPAISAVAGDYYSAGYWARASILTGAAALGSGYHSTFNVGESTADTETHAAGDRDWTFITHEKQATATRTVARLDLIGFGAFGYQLRYDDAFIFKGRWKVSHADPIRLPIKPRVRPNKTDFTSTNFISGRGGFEEDSNADGVADGWSKTGSTNTYTLERDPDFLSTTVVGIGASQGAQKVVLSAATTDQLRLIYRGHFKAGETWRFQVNYMNSGALGGAPANGDFGIVLHTEEFDGTYETSSLSGANFVLTSRTAYGSAKSRTVLLTADHSVLVCDINLKTASGGTLWLDDAALFRSA